MTDSSAQQSGACLRINSASRSRMQTKHDERRIALVLWIVPKSTGCGLPLLASTLAAPVLRREASMANTRIYRNRKIESNGVKTECTNSKTTLFLTRSSNGPCEEQNSQSSCRYCGGDIYHAGERSKDLRD